MFRNVGAALVGIVVAFVLVAAIEELGHTIYPPPADLDRSDPEGIKTYLATSPFLAILFPMIAWVIAAFVGSLVASKIGTANPLVFSGVVGLVVLASAIAILIVIPHPAWYSIVSVIAVPASAWFAAKVASGRDSAATAAED